MRNLESRIKKLEDIFAPKNVRVLIIDNFTDEPESYILINDEKIIIPVNADVNNFIKEKIDEHKRHMSLYIVGLYISRNEK